MRIRSRNKRRHSRLLQRRSLFESLEERTVLSASPLDLHGGVDLDDHLTDAGYHTDMHGNEYHVLPIAEMTDNGDVGDAGNPMGAPPFSLANTFQLHSNPGAQHTVYLDFDGSTTSGTSWNSSFNSNNDIVTGAYSFEGDSSFSDNELERIQRIWQRVSEDFIPFDVNVTTQDPGSAALSKAGGGDPNWGVRVVIGGDGAWYGSAGGVAYIGSFNWSSDTPTFVFEDNLANGHEKYTAEAISHEVGHTLWLYHDGRTSPAESYYAGHGSGATGWAPIMGVGYYRELTQWSSGEYLNANNTENDLSIITTQNGFGYRADDHGNANGSATALTASTNTVSGAGIIEQNSDLDVFSFTTGSGVVNLQINPFERGPNLDITASLYDSNGSLVASSNPTSTLNASFNLNLGAGQYFVHVYGDGNGDPLGSGYSDYANLGAFSISGTVIEPTLADQLGSTRDSMYFYLDTSENGVWSTVAGGDTFNDFHIMPLMNLATTIVGDWDGDGTDDLGLYHNGYFYLDATGNGTWDGVAGGDTFRDFGINPIRSTAMAVIGDWDGDGTDDLGLYNNGYFYLDTTGNGVWNGVAGGDTFRDFGINSIRSTAKAVIGDWDGDGTDDLGLHNNGYFYLDTTDNGVWNGVAGGDTFRDFGINPIRGTATAVVGDWDGDGTDDIGQHNDRYFYLDTTGNGVWNGVSGGDTFYDYGFTGTPVVGKWATASPAPVVASTAAGSSDSVTSTVSSKFSAGSPIESPSIATSEVDTVRDSQLRDQASVGLQLSLTAKQDTPLGARDDCQSCDFEQSAAQDLFFDELGRHDDLNAQVLHVDSDDEDALAFTTAAHELSDDMPDELRLFAIHFGNRVGEFSP